MNASRLLASDPASAPDDLSDAQATARAVLREGGALDRDHPQHHWSTRAYGLTTGAILHLRLSPGGGTATVADLRALFAAGDAPLHAAASASHDPDLRRGWTDAAGRPTATCPLVAHALRTTLDSPEGERNAILAACVGFIDWA